MPNNKPDLKFIPQSEVAVQWQKYLDQNQTADDFFPTGFTIHDQTLGRLRRGMLAVVAGSTSMGKTAFMLSMALHQLALGIRVFWFCLEIQQVDMFSRMVSIKTGIPLLNIIERRLSDEDRRLILKTLPTVSDLPVNWTEDSKLSHLLKRLAENVQKGSRSIVFVDHLHLVSVPGLGVENRYSLVTHALLSLKNAAMDLAVPIVCGCQVNRQASDNRPPMISDARSSGEIGEGCQLFLALHRPGFNNRNIPDDKLEICCRKNTHGPIANYILEWDGPCAAVREKIQPSDRVALGGLR